MKVDKLNQQTVKMSLNEGEKVHIMEPSSIIMFNGHSSQREDRFLSLKLALKAKRMSEAILSGPCEFILSLPSGCFIDLIPVQKELLYELKNILFYTEDLQPKRVTQSWRNMIATASITRYQFMGSGQIGVMTGGPIVSVEISKDKAPLFIDVNSLVALPKSSKPSLSTYGNKLAEQTMNWQYSIMGEGSVLIEAASSIAVLATQGETQDNVIMRTMKHYVPGADIVFK